MDASTVLDLVKAKLGISTTVRDTYLTAIIDGVIKELEDEQGLVLNSANPYHLMFVVDYCVWRYQNKGKDETPRHLKFRLHNLIVHNRNIIVNDIVVVSALPISPAERTAYILSDNDKQIYINEWIAVDIIDGIWVAI